VLAKKDFPESEILRGVTKQCKKKTEEVLDFIEDECAGEIIEAFCGLRAKLSSYKMYKGHEEKSEKV